MPLVLTFELYDAPELLELLEAGVERVRASEHTPITTSPPYKAGPGLVAVDVTVSEDPRVYQAFLFVLLELDLWERTHLDLPSVLDPGLAFEAEPPGVEWWRSSFALRSRGSGDCEDFATDYAAELVLSGQPAAPSIELELDDGHGRRFHVVTLIETAPGVLERRDLSREIEALPWL